MATDPETAGSGTSTKKDLAAFGGVGVLALVCCAVGPVVITAASGVAFATILGATAGLLALVGVALLVAGRRRRGRANASSTDRRC